MRSALALSVCMLMGPVMADEACKDQQASLSGISDKYKSQYDGYQKDGEHLKDESVNFKIDVTWKNQEIILGVPSVTMKDQKLVFGVPQVTMRLQELVFGTPSVRMKTIVTGSYPEFTCDHAFIPHCTVTWSHTYADVPEPFMQEQHIKLDIPEFKWADTEIIMGIPEFKLEQQRWVIGLPQFKLDSVYINSGKIKTDSDDLQQKISSTKANQVKETSTAVHVMFDCQRNLIIAQRDKVGVQFNSGLSMMNGVITGLQTQGADPHKVKSADGTITDLVTARDDLIKKRDEALALFDDALTKVENSEKEAIAKMTST